MDCLAVDEVSAKANDVITEHAWHNRANWEDEAWETWETWGWYRHWGRTVSVLLRSNPYRAYVWFPSTPPTCGTT